MTNPQPIPESDLAQLFPAKRPNPIKPGAFELGLILGGTASAGAYTGGVIDYIVHALDAWTRAKEDGTPLAPPHEVVISTIAGTSGGAINGAILLRAAGWEFDHGPAQTNPFYSSWTMGVDLMNLLAVGGDGDADGLVSVFNCQAIDKQAATTVAFTGQPLGSGPSPRHRSYLGDPLRLFMMVGNVTGLPYTVSLRGETGLSHGLVAHADFMRFGLTVENGVPNLPQSRPDEVALASTSPINWDILSKAALATSAFPLVFRSRPLSRPLESSGYRAIAVPAESGDATVVQLIPQWEVLRKDEPLPATTNFANVDGGTMNNEPLDVVRTTLAGLDGRNKRQPSKVDRAVILVDPFSDPEMLGPRQPPRLTKLVLPFVMSLIYQARFKPADIALAYDEKTYSRYLIAPVGPGPHNQRTVGKAAIASGGLGGFLGFVDTRFLRYDFALGQLNARSFLAKHLAIPESENNPIFDTWTTAQRNEYRFSENGVAYLPLIPLMKALRDNPPELPDWPAIAAVPAGLSNGIERRLDAVYNLVTAESAPDSWFKRAAMSLYLGLGWRFYLRGALRDMALESIRKGLQDQGLLS